MTLIDDAITEAANAEPLPSNEAATEAWIINPILLAMGYLRREILPRVGDANGQYPDFTVLPDTAFTWFLEAKTWGTELQDAHAQQSLNYANQNGKRWVILSNGREWRLYDNQIQGLARDKLVTGASLFDSSAIHPFLEAASKLSVTTGGLEVFAKQTRLTSVLTEQLRDEGSEIVRSIWSILRLKPGLLAATRSDVTAFFSGSPAISAIPSPPIRIKTQRKRTALQPTGSSVDLETLSNKAADLATGKKPLDLTCPDGVTVASLTWKDIAHGIVQWLASQDKLPPLPFRGKAHGGHYFLNTTPDHSMQPMRTFSEVSYVGGSVFIDTHRSAYDILHCLVAVCRESAVQPSDFKVGL